MTFEFQFAVQNNIKFNL